MTNRRVPNRTATRKPASPISRELAAVKRKADVVNARASVRAALTDLHEVRVAVDTAELAAVALLRHAGIPWSEIGAALGISKQAAQQRFGALVNGS